MLGFKTHQSKKAVMKLLMRMQLVTCFARAIPCKLMKTPFLHLKDRGTRHAAVLHSYIHQTADLGVCLPHDSKRAAGESVSYLLCWFVQQRGRQHEPTTVIWEGKPIPEGSPGYQWPKLQLPQPCSSGWIEEQKDLQPLPAWLSCMMKVHVQ